MTLYELLGSSSIFIIATSLIQVSKIPINPWNWLIKLLKILGKSIGNVINEDIYNELTEIKKTQNLSFERIDTLDVSINVLNNNLENLKSKSEQENINKKRSEILNFYNSCYQGIKHSREEFDNIIDIYTEYESIISAKGYVNGKISLAYDYIMKLYKECEKNHSFI